MTNALRLWFVEVPAKPWAERLERFVREALVVERLLGKEVRPRQLREQYALLCDRIAAVGWDLVDARTATSKELLGDGSSHVSERYLEGLLFLREEARRREARGETELRSLRIGASFVPPELVQKHARDLEKFLKELGGNPAATGAPDLGPILRRNEMLKALREGSGWLELTAVR